MAYTPQDGALPESIAMKWFVGYLERQKIQNQEILFVVPTLNHTENNFAVAVGQDVAKSLRKGSIDYHGNRARVCSERKIPSYFDGLIVNFYCSGKDLEKIDDTGAPFVLTITWERGPWDEWIDIWNAVEIHGRPIEMETIELDRIVCRALDSLTIVVNLSTGLAHPRDKERCDALFHILKENNVPFDPVAVKKYCIQKGWSARHAEQVKKVAERIQKLKKPGLIKPCWAKDIFQKWKA